MLNGGAVATTLFLGGWQSPIPIDLPVPPLLSALGPIFWFVAKVLAFILLYMWLRATLPRLRYDQLMRFTWKGLLPLALANIMLIATILTVRYPIEAGQTSQAKNSRQLSAVSGQGQTDRADR